MGLGDAKAAKGENEAAIAHYQKALSLDPLNARVQFALGKIYYSEKGLYYEAVTAYKKAIDLDQSFLEARMGLGEIYEEKGLYKDAVTEYKKVIEIEPKHTAAHYNLAMAYEKLDPQEAIAQWERYIGIASTVATEKEWVDVARQHLKKLKDKYPSHSKSARVARGGSSAPLESSPRPALLAVLSSFSDFAGCMFSTQVSHCRLAVKRAPARL